jgi:hypothetical protein
MDNGRRRCYRARPVFNLDNKGGGDGGFDGACVVGACNRTAGRATLPGRGSLRGLRARSARVDVAGARPRARDVLVRPRPSVRRRAASRHRDRGRRRVARGRAGVGCRQLRRLGSDERAGRHDPDRRRARRQLDAARNAARRARRAPRRRRAPRDGRPERNARVLGAVRPPRNPHRVERPGLPRSARLPPARARRPGGAGPTCRDPACGCGACRGPTCRGPTCRGPTCRGRPTCRGGACASCCRTGHGRPCCRGSGSRRPGSGAGATGSTDPGAGSTRRAAHRAARREGGRGARRRPRGSPLTHAARHAVARGGHPPRGGRRARVAHGRRRPVARGCGVHAPAPIARTERSAAPGAGGLAARKRRRRCVAGPRASRRCAAGGRSRRAPRCPGRTPRGPGARRRGECRSRPRGRSYDHEPVSRERRSERCPRPRRRSWSPSRGRTPAVRGTSGTSRVPGSRPTSSRAITG